jgi:acetate kinase
MNILTLRPSLHQLRYAFFTGDLRDAPRLDANCRIERAEFYPAELLGAVADASRACPAEPQVVAIRAVHGGDVLLGPAIVNQALLGALEAEVSCAPLHLPALINAGRACLRVFPNAIVVAVPETAFFAQLPGREQVYGLDAATRRNLRLRRFGFHGLFHQAACKMVATQRFGAGSYQPPRVLSICLEPRPEIASVLGTRPLTVTSGATPLEGLPGETNCGALDPGIVLRLVKHASLGPEQIDALLTRQSGLRGLTGTTASLGEVLTSHAPQTRLAREVFEYRALLACGEGLAALGALDAIVLSGRYAQAGDALVRKLRQQLDAALGNRACKIEQYLLDASLDQLLAAAGADCARTAQCPTASGPQLPAKTQDPAYRSQAPGLG